MLALEDVFGRRATNVVMMGMGEPLMNLKEVLRAHRCLNRDVGIGGRYFTISTVGVPNQLSKLAAHKLQATLAVSLHAPDAGAQGEAHTEREGRTTSTTYSRTAVCTKSRPGNV